MVIVTVSFCLHHEDHEYSLTEWASSIFQVVAPGSNVKGQDISVTDKSTSSHFSKYFFFVEHFSLQHFISKWKMFLCRNRPRPQLSRIWNSRSHVEGIRWNWKKLFFNSHNNCTKKLFLTMSETQSRNQTSKVNEHFQFLIIFC